MISTLYREVCAAEVPVHVSTKYSVIAVSGQLPWYLVLGSWSSSQSHKKLQANRSAAIVDNQSMWAALVCPPPGYERAACTRAAIGLSFNNAKTINNLDKDSLFSIKKR